MEREMDLAAAWMLLALFFVNFRAHAVAIGALLGAYVEENRFEESIDASSRKVIQEHCARVAHLQSFFIKKF
jgi:hypothetical protein